MKAINIYTYSRIQENMATEFENILSQRSKKLNVKVQEFIAIKTLVDLLRNMETEIKYFENFFKKILFVKKKNPEKISRFLIR